MNPTQRLSTEEALPATRAIPRSPKPCGIRMCGRDRLNLRHSVLMSLMKMHGLVWLETTSPKLVKRVSTADEELPFLNRTRQSILTVRVTDLNWRLQPNALIEPRSSRFFESRRTPPPHRTVCLESNPSLQDGSLSRHTQSSSLRTDSFDYTDISTLQAERQFSFAPTKTCKRKVKWPHSQRASSTGRT
jgi:hypothetical protein